MFREIRISDAASVRANLDDSAYGRLRSIFASGGRVGVACSGGADSVFLLRVLAAEFGAENLAVLHFNHKVRAAAEIDEKFVESECAKLGAEFVRGSPDETPRDRSEGGLRALRLAFFEKSADDLKLAAVAQGHHAGDVAETLLMRLVRGAGLGGLCAPRPISRLRGVEYLRPILGMSKREIVAAMESAGLAWREDESNAGLDYFRNRIRNAVLPAFAEASQYDVFAGAVRSRGLLQEDADALDALFSAEYARANAGKPDGGGVFLSESILAHAAFVRRAVEKFLSERGLCVRASAADAFVRGIAAHADARLDAGAVFVDFSPRDFSLSAVPKKTDFELSVRVGGSVALPDGSALCARIVALSPDRADSIKSGGNDDRVSAYLNPSALCGGDSLRVRARRDGDAYAPVGRRSPKKLKTLFEGKKTPRPKRISAPVVCNCAGEILWVRGLAPADKFKLADSAEALELTFCRTV